jgi:D-alanyl-D-alanine carboxypeptidase (penicillin-binding protein 5/6)
VLLDYGFSLYETEILAEVGDVTFDVPVCGGVKSSVAVYNPTAVTAFLPRNHERIEAMVELPRFLYGGIHEGEAVGCVRFFVNGDEVGSVPLVASESVSAIPKKQSLFEKLLSFFCK